MGGEDTCWIRNGVIRGQEQEMGFLWSKLMVCSGAKYSADSYLCHSPILKPNTYPFLYHVHFNYC